MTIKALKVYRKQILQGECKQGKHKRASTIVAKAPVFAEVSVERAETQGALAMH